MAGFFNFWKWGKEEAPRSPLPEMDDVKDQETVLYSGTPRGRSALPEMNGIALHSDRAGR